MRHILLQATPISILEPHFIVGNAVELADELHEGQTRHRPNDDGTAREYICHTLEVAFIAAHYEVALRKKHEENLSDDFVVQAIVDAVDASAKMDKHDLKHALMDIASRLDVEQLRQCVGLICHDIVEKNYKRNLLPGEILTPEVKQRIAAPILRQVAQVMPGAEDIVKLLTDPIHIANKAQKAREQSRLAGSSEVYAKLKSIDAIANTNDQASIPLEERSLEDMCRKMDAMGDVVSLGLKRPGREHLRHIHMAYDIVHARTTHKLAVLKAA